MCILSAPARKIKLISLVRFRPVDELIGRSVLVRDQHGRFRIRVTSVRDLVKEPLTLGEYLDDPFAEYGRYLLDTDHGQLSLGPRATLHLALYQGERLSELLARPFAPNEHDRSILANLCRQWVESDWRDLMVTSFGFGGVVYG